MSVFDGMTGILNQVFGATVLLCPKSGGQQIIRAVFRREPVEVDQDRGRSVLIAAPTLKVPEPVASTICRDDMIEVDGLRYVVLNKMPNASPAADRFVMFELEEVPL